MANTRIKICERLRTLGAATVYEAQGAIGALDSGIKPVDPGMRMAGPAFTVDMRPADNLMLHYALMKAQPGQVLVVDCKGFLEAGPWGDVLTAQAVKLGLAGLLIHGAVRDAEVIVKQGFPVFCRGLSIKGTAKNQPGLIDVAVHFGDVCIRPGDYVVGDRDGVAIVPAERVNEVLELAEHREAKESLMRQAIAQGATTVELMGLSEALRRHGLS
jgi:4-hydroxy-4-methyl-2-oxoglutarate aldolase